MRILMMMMMMVMVILKNNEGDEAHMVVVIFIGAKIMYCYTRCMPRNSGILWLYKMSWDCVRGGIPLLDSFCFVNVTKNRPIYHTPNTIP
jgi:uncharacterized membrane protein